MKNSLSIMDSQGFVRQIKLISQEITIKVDFEKYKIIITPLDDKEDVLIYDSLFNLLRSDTNIGLRDVVEINGSAINVKCECIFDLSKIKNKSISIAEIFFTERARFNLLYEFDVYLKFYRCIFEKEFQFGSRDTMTYFRQSAMIEECEFKDTLDIFNIAFDNKVIFYKVKFGESLKENLSSSQSINILFENSIFKSSLGFQSCKFYTITEFNEVKFFDNTTFINSTFYQILSLKKCEFMNTAEFSFANFLDSLMFSYVIFHNNVIFTNALMCYDISLMDVSFRDAQSVQMAGLTIATNFKTIKKKIDEYSVENKQYNKVNVSSIIQDSFRLIKDILIAQNNILLASSWHRLELYSNEIFLTNELKIKEFKKDIQMLDDEEQITHNKRLESIKSSYLLKRITQLQLWFYRTTSDHHTDLLKIIQWIIVLVGYFSFLLFLSKYGLNLRDFFESHSSNNILSFIKSYSPIFVFSYKFISVISVLFLLGFFYIYIRIFVGLLGTCFLVITNPKYIFGVTNLFNSSSYSGVDNIILTFYSVFAILFIFSLQKTARRNSIIPK